MALVRRPKATSGGGGGPTAARSLGELQGALIFQSKMMIFYMICSTFVDHLYTENGENDDFAVEKKKHEFGMKK